MESSPRPNPTSCVHTFSGAQADSIRFTKLQPNTDVMLNRQRIKVSLMTASDAKRHNRDMKPFVVSGPAVAVLFSLSCTSTTKRKKGKS